MFNKLLLKPHEINYVIYHKNCSDGFGAATCAHRFLKGKEVEYYGAVHQTPPPDVTNKNVAIFDFSYSEEVLKKMIESANKLAVIDHHRSAEKNLENIGEEYKVFRMDHSGAYLAFKYFFPKEKIPAVITYIQDRDIWTNEQPFIQQYSAWFFTLPFEFEIYEKYFDDEVFMKELKGDANGMMKLNNYNVERISSRSVVKFVKIKEKYYFVACVNSNVLKSDVGNYILRKVYPLADFSMIYDINDRNDTTSISLRSTDTGADVSKIASGFGGGGHKCASGVRVSHITNSLGLVLDKGRLFQYVTEHIVSQTILLDRKYHIVILNINQSRRAVLKYLLQKKYKTVQNAGVILSKIYDNDLYTERVYDFAIGYYSDHKKDKKNMRIVCNEESVSDKDKLEFTNHLRIFGGTIDPLDPEVVYI